MKRVAVTGIGVVSPVGSDLENYWDALVEGRSGIGPLTSIPTDRLSINIAAQVKNYVPEENFDAKAIPRLDRFAQFAVIAARKAVADAGLDISEELAETAATIVGTGVGGQNTLDDAYYRLYAQNAPKLHPFTIPRLMVNAGASQISMDLGLQGPTFSVASACASGAHAIGLAFEMVRSGRAPVALAGGAEACITVGTLKGWEALRALSSDTCRPFSRTRSGLVLGEGAAILVLEPMDSAMARGARIYAEVRGFGMTADATDIIVPNAGGSGRAMRAALKDAGANTDGIDYINAHGTGTMLNDTTETQAIRAVFASHADRLAVSSSKAVLGHGLGAAGALEAAATVLAIQRRVFPPTANYEEPDSTCDLDVVPNTARDGRIRCAISNSFAFGGLNAVLAFGEV